MGQISISRKAASFTESVIREMTRLALTHDAINLAQGFPDFHAPAEVKDAAVRAICADVNQYAITWERASSAGRLPSASAKTPASRSTPSARSRSAAARQRP